MNRGLVLGVAVFFGAVGISLVGDQPQAQGGWWHRAANCGGWGWGGMGPYGAAWAGYGGYGYGGGWGACFGYAPTACYGWTGCYGWSGCGGMSACYGVADCGGYGGYSTGYGVADCCGDGVMVDGKGGGGAVQKDGDVMDGPIDEEPTPAVPQTPPVPKLKQPATGTSAQLNLQVPQDAKVVINNYATNSTGTLRRYVSRGLQPNTEYQFEIRAEVTRNGAQIERTKLVRVRANETADVAFDFTTPQMASVSR